ncbi:MAG: tRNA epoxyqueuosine(34) reductase QueG [Thermogutta sp.]
MSSHIVIRLKEHAKDLGFCCVGISPAVEPPHYGAFLEWLQAGFHGEMNYLAKRKAAYRTPTSILPEVQSVIMLGFPYMNIADPQPRPGFGTISRYAAGEDYHRLIRDRLQQLGEFLIAEYPGASVRGVVDTAPLLERDFAHLAGLGWIGKSTSLIHPEYGSYLFLAALLTSVELEWDPPFTEDLCGLCSKCLRACPTGALVAPKILDARRCLSYLTIELKSGIPEDLRACVGDWFFGCDICQAVCPWNRKTWSIACDDKLRGDRAVNLIALFSWDEHDFREAFGSTALWRAKRRGLLRNAAIVLGNQRCQSAWDVLVQGLKDSEDIVREACAWALIQIDPKAAIPYLTSRLSEESDAIVAWYLSRYLEKAATLM